jgi:endogenous inhibitor of DNA gyrase (YacG/DUF329 family)
VTERTHWPFCCERCKLLDLGRWLDGDYRVASERVGTEADDDVAVDAPEDHATN